MEFLRQSLGLSSPFCPLYLLAGFCACGGWLMRTQKMSARESWNYVCARIKSNRKALGVDGIWTMFHLIFLRLPIALTHIALFDWAYAFMQDEIPLSVDWQTATWIEGLLATLVTMLAIDFSAYGLHRAFHSWSWLWKIHRVHHSARFLTPLTTLRQHPLEPLLLNGIRGLAAGLALGFLHLLFPAATPVWTIGGIGAGFFFYMFTVNLHHAPIPLRYPAVLSMLLVSPHIHHLHHSRAVEHHGRNFGVVFSFWDRIFGSYQDQTFGLDELRFGLDEDSSRLR